MYTEPQHHQVDDGDYYEPPAHSLLFEVDGKPVCVTEELTCYRFGSSDVEDMDIQLVRQRGKPITRPQFDALRVV